MDVGRDDDEEVQTLVTIEALIQALELAERDCPSDALSAFRRSLEHIIRPN